VAPPAFAVEGGESLPELVGRTRRRPRLDSEIKRLGTFELRPVPSHFRELPALGRECGPVDLLQGCRRLGRQVEAPADRFLQESLGLSIDPTEFAAVLQRVRQVDEVGLRRVVEQRPQLLDGVAASGRDEIGDEARVLRDRVEDPAVPAEPALVREGLCDVVEIDLAGIGGERIDAPAADRLYPGPGFHAGDYRSAAPCSRAR
jgi:hypothetical protein